MGQLGLASQAMNNANEKLCLKWNEFQDIAISAFGTLREDKDFADVTLACEDGLQVEAHKVILASSSPFFLDILKRNKHPHPLIYMCGLTFENLVPMLDFFYYGEANVYQENLESFLAVAEELQLKGLMGSDAEEEVVSSNNEHPPDGITPTPSKRDCNTSTLEKGGKESTLEETLASTANKRLETFQQRNQRKKEEKQKDWTDWKLFKLETLQKNGNLSTKKSKKKGGKTA